MKSILCGIGVVVLSAGMAVADPVEGVWKTPPSDGVFYHINMKTCGTKICGSYMKKFENGKEVANPYQGKNAVYDMVNSGGGSYVGKAWRGSDDKTFKGKGQLNGNTFTMKGCVLGGLICIGQEWKRVQ